MTGWDEGLDPDSVAAMLRRTYPNTVIAIEAAVREEMHADLTLLMEALGISTHARPATPHEVMVNEVIPRARLLMRSPVVLQTVSEQRIRQLEHHVEVLCSTIEDIVANPETVGVEWTAERWEAIRVAIGNARAVIAAYD